MSKTQNFTGFVVIGCVALLVFSMIWPSVGPKADEPKPGQVADHTDGKDVTVKKLSNQVYRVDVEKTGEAVAVYEAELVKFSKDHPSVHPSPAPPNPKGNIGSTTYYWNVDEK